MNARQKNFCGGLAILLFFCALCWAAEQDPFSRKWFTLETAGFGSFKCVAVLPKPMRQYPVVIYAHGSCGTLMNDGNDLRQMAELGLAVVSFEYDQTNEAAFRSQFNALLGHISRKKWADTNAVAWVGFGLGANRLSNFLLQHPEQKPQSFVQLSDGGPDPSVFDPRLSIDLHYPMLLVRGDHNEILPSSGAKYLVSALPTGSPVEGKTIPSASQEMQPERGIVFRAIGEYCRDQLVANDAWRNYQSVAQWQAETPPSWLFWLPAAVWVAGWFAWLRLRKTAVPEKIKLNHHNIALSWLAILLTTWASAETAINLVTPCFSVGDATLSIARKLLVEPKQRADFEYLATHAVWRGIKLKTLLEHVELAGYNRELINGQLDDKIYQDYVLSPVITGNAGEQLNWRRLLWEEFYPRVRHELSPEDTAKVVIRHLRERVTLAPLPSPPREVPVIWRRQITDATGFEIISVAALRSVGVPARLNSQGHVEFWEGSKWQSDSPDCLRLTIVQF
jgi:hypothetical protein